MRRIVVTGLGAVTPVGNDVPSTWGSLLAGRSGIDHIRHFPVETFPVRIAGTVKNFELSERLADPRLTRLLGRGGGFGVAAMLEALGDAGFSKDLYDPGAMGIAVGSLCPRPAPEYMVYRTLSHLHPERSAELVYHSPLEMVAGNRNTGVGVMGVLSGCEGPVISTDNACSSAANAIGAAFQCIQDGEAKLMIAGGYGDYTWMDLIGFFLLGALARDGDLHPEKAFRPFDRKRGGFVLGEGSVIMILEDQESALQRGARIYAELVGYASSMNAYRITDSPVDGGGAVIAMQRALEQSGLATTDIDYVAAHGTATEDNDRAETAALKQVFGDHAYALAISAPKAMTGHLLGAAAALNLLVSICAMRDGIVPPTVNLENPDPALDLDYIPNVARRMRVRAALVNAYGFAGVNTSLIVRRAGAADEAAAA
jgi:3-oxoacyl-[acyl-carrier-protein] synthase II